MIDAPAENRFRFTKSALAALPAPASGRAVYHDTEVKGLIYRITATGSRSFYLAKWSKAEGKPIYRHLGDADMHPDTARKAAIAAAARINAGENPNVADRQARHERKTDTLADLWNLYVTEHHPKCRAATIRVDVSMYERHICGRDKKTREKGESIETPIGMSNRTARSFTADDVRNLHRQISTSSGKTVADRVVALLSRMYRHARVEPNPARADKAGRTGVQFNGTTSIVRYLTPDQYRALVAALDADADQEGCDVLRLALWSGQRKENVLAAKWSDIDLNLRVWRIHAEHFKTGKTVDTPLADEAVAMLKRRLAEKRSEFVFPSRRDVDKPMVDVRLTKDRVFDAAGLTGFRFHDLRHACASAIIFAGGSLIHAGRQLNHRDLKSTARYAHLDVTAARTMTTNAFAALAASGMEKPKRRGK